LNSHPPLLSFILPPPVPRIVSTDIIFAFTYMCTHYMQCIHPPTPVPHNLLTPTSANPPFTSGRTCSAILFYNFVEVWDKDREFPCVEIKIVIQGISLCCFHAYMCYNPNWFISLVLFTSFLVLFPWWPQPV
jgi:hypothetical protein